MKTLKSFADLQVGPELILKEAENKLFKAFETKRIRTAFQLRRWVAGIPGALGPALKQTAAFAVIETLLRGTWVPRAWN